MVCEPCGHRRASWLPSASWCWLWHGDAQRLMRAYEIEDRILKFEMAPQERAFLRMRQCFAHQPSITLARREVVTVTVGRRVTPPTTAPKRRMKLSPHAAPQYLDACHAYLAGGSLGAPAFSHYGSVHEALADSQSAHRGDYHCYGPPRCGRHGGSTAHSNDTGPVAF